MGICASIQSKKTRKSTNGPSTIKVINSVDGKMEEFEQPIKAHQLLSSDNPNTFFLCNAEEMFVNRHVPHVPADEELQLGQIYFIVPMSESNKILTLQEMCLYAVKASKAIEKAQKERRARNKTVSCNGRRRRNRNGNDNGEFQLALRRFE